MAALSFYFGTMGAGKSTTALQIHHNLGRTSRGALFTQHDREGATVSSALGISAAATLVEPDLDFVAEARRLRREAGALDYLICDEAQFYTEAQVEQLARVVDDLEADVHAFGLLTDFRGRLFPATARLLELADERHEIQVQSRCWCGSPATHNARLVNGVQVYDGDVVVIDDGSETSVTYELRCRKHWIQGRSSDSADGLRAVG